MVTGHYRNIPGLKRCSLGGNSGRGKAVDGGFSQTGLLHVQYIPTTSAINKYAYRRVEFAILNSIIQESNRCAY